MGTEAGTINYGWIKVNRSMLDHWLWQIKPFDEARAWIDLVLLANYEDKKAYCRGKLVTCERGTVNLSIDYLANRWGWSWRKAKDYLTTLENDQMISTNITKRCTTIKISNYEAFQGVFSDQVQNRLQNKQQNRLQNKQQNRLQNKQQNRLQNKQQITKNNKNKKNNKNNIANFSNERNYTKDDFEAMERDALNG